MKWQEAFLGRSGCVQPGCSRVHIFRSLSLLALGLFLLGMTPFARAQSGTIISKIEPSIGETGVPVNSAVVFTFSTNMNTALTRVQFINGSVVPPTTLALTAAWNADGTQMTNIPNPVFPAGKAILWFASGVDAWGRALTGTLNGGFLTASPGTVSLLSVSPPNQAVNVPTNATVQFTFSSGMDPAQTQAAFTEYDHPEVKLAVLNSWSADRKTLNCTPSAAFPPGTIILWSIQGIGAAGEAFAWGGGGFTTAGTRQTNIVFSAILSRGDRAEQTSENLFRNDGLEFCALADSITGLGVAFAAPGQTTNILGRNGAAKTVEFRDGVSDAATFAAEYPSGKYNLLSGRANRLSNAVVSLSDGTWPKLAVAAAWPPQPAVLGKPLAVSWTLSAEGGGVDYIRVTVEQNGRILFATPHLGSPGALASASNFVMVPSSAFSQAGRAKVRISTFTFTGLDTNSVPGLTLRAARHRTSTFALPILDPATPAPFLNSTNFASLALGESFLYPMRVTNGARPLKFSIAGGSLPPGLALQPDGTLAGQPTAAGDYPVSIQVEDALGQTTTNRVRMSVAQSDSAVVRIENATRGPGGDLQFEVVGNANAHFYVERSSDLVSWNSWLATNSTSTRVLIQAPLASGTAFFRVRSTGTAPPHPLTVAPVLNPASSASAHIGFFGGQLKLTNAANYVVTLDVPPGALQNDQQITMTEISQIGALPLSGGLQAAVDLQPEGIYFDRPVRLDIAAPRDIIPSRVSAFNARHDGSEFALSYTFITNRTVSFYLRHFTVGGFGEGTSSDVASQAGNTPTDPWTAADQETESKRRECLAGDCNPDDLKDSLLKYYLQMADQVVIPELTSASKSAEDGLVDYALQTYIGWAHDVQWIGISNDPLGQDQNQESELGKRLRRMTSLASTAIANGMTKACQQCLKHDIGRMQRMLTLEGYAQLLGWSHEQQLLDCFNQCMVFKMKIDSEIYADTPAGLLLTHTKAEVKLEPIEANVVDQWLLHGTASYQGTAEWQITSVREFETQCPIAANPESGQANFPLVHVKFFRKETVNDPKAGAIVTYVLDPHLEVYLRASKSEMPREDRTMYCEGSDPVDLGDIYGPTFLSLHNDEIISPESGSLEEMMLGGPCVKVTDFEGSGSGEILFTKEFNRTESKATEVTTIELRHTPQ